MRLNSILTAAVGYFGVACTLLSAAERATTIPSPASILRALSTTQPVDAAKGDSVASLRQAIAAFATNGSALAPEEAAKQWWALADREAMLSPQQRYTSDDGQPPLQMQSVIAVLPPPAAWPAIAQQLAARPKPSADRAHRRNAALLLTHLLTGDRAAARADLAALIQTRGASPAFNRSAYQSAMHGGPFAVVQKFVSDTTQPSDIASSIKAEIDGFAKNRNYGYFQTLTLPDLATEVGADKATELLQLAMSAPVNIDVPIGDATRLLARQVALKSIDKMTIPQWGLTNSLDSDSLALFEALHKKFPQGYAMQSQGFAGALFSRHQSIAVNDYRLQPFRTAQTYYILNLAVHNRSADALAAAKAVTGGLQAAGIDEPILTQLVDQGGAESVQSFLHELLSDDPSRPFWSMYIATSAQTGKAREALELAQRASARSGLTSTQRRATDAQVYKALLAADRVDDAIAAMRQLVATPTSQPASEPIGETASTNDDTDSSASPDTAGEENTTHAVALDLIRIGGALKRPELVDEGLAALDVASTDSNAYETYQAREVASALDDAGRPIEAAKVLADSFIRMARGGNSSNQYLSSSAAADALIDLAGVYDRAGRHGDVLMLLDSFPQWSADDLAAICTSSDHTETPLGYMAAAALADAGRNEQALQIDKVVLEHLGGFDPAYELLIKLDPTGAAAFLDQLFARDQFEERPLIWKAELARRAGDLPTAEKLSRQAIAIDPSDGEQGPGRRMRAYGVLADTLEAEGHADDAKVYRGAVAAIRESEQGDRFRTAGLLTRAVSLYSDSLNKFADAYCIQSRLAKQQAELGMVSEAAEHYRRAFELMPVSFGRMESHCFGCEGAFKGPSAQAIAEKVFSDLLAKEPNKPQVSYLLGYLREEQGRWSDAAKEFEAATHLDPDYINAWSNLSKCSEHVELTDDQLRIAALAILRLDPLGRHVSPETASVHDLTSLYNAAITSGQIKSQIVLPTSLYPLRAAGAAAKHTSYYDRNYGDDNAPGNEGGKLIAKHPAIVAAVGLMEGE